MKDGDSTANVDLEQLDKVLEEIPITRPSRDLVAAAIEEALPVRRSMAWWLMRVAAAAAAVFVVIVGLPPENQPAEPLPTDAEIAARLSRTSVRSAKYRRRVHVATYDKRTKSLSDRIKRARQKSRAWKKRMKREGEGHV